MPALKVRSAGAIVPAKSVKVRWGGALVTAKAYWVKSGGVLVKVWSAIVALTASKSGDASGTMFEPEPAPMQTSVSTNAVTITASGGTGSYTYSWALISGNAGGISSTTAASVYWTDYVTKNSTKQGVWRCTVTSGAQTAIIDVYVTLDYFTDL